MTVKDVIRQLNDDNCHQAGMHLTMVRLDLLPQCLAYAQTAYNIIQQTYDWRYYPPERDEYVVELSAEDMKYIGNALEVYNGIMSELHVEPKLKELIEKMGDTLC